MSLDLRVDCLDHVFSITHTPMESNNRQDLLSGDNLEDCVKQRHVRT